MVKAVTTGTGTQGNPEGPEKLSGAPTPLPETAEKERRALLEELMEKKTKGDRLELSKSLSDELKQSKTSEKERAELLHNVAEQHELEQVKLHVAELQKDPEKVDEAKVEALYWMRDTLPFLYASWALEYGLKDPGSISEVLAIKDKSKDPLDLAFLEGLQFLNENRKLTTAEYFFNAQYPLVVGEAKALTDAARQVKDAVDGKDKEGEKSWLRQKVEEHPKTTAALLGLGALGVGYMVGRWLMNKARGNLEGQPAETADGQGVVQRVSSGFSWLKSWLFRGALFTGATLVLGRVMGIEEVEKYLRQNKLGNWLYDNRFIGGVIHILNGRVEEGLAFLHFGARDGDARTRHQTYAEQFGVPDMVIWSLAGLKFKDVLEAEKGREHPLGTGVFASIPFIKDFFKLPHQVLAEEKLQDLLVAKKAEIYKLVPNADELTMDEVLKIAFEKNLFKPEESEGMKDAPEALTDYYVARETDVKDFDKSLEGFEKPKETLNAGEIELLNKSGEHVTKKLDELRLVLPDFFSNLDERVLRVFPWLAINQGDTEKTDLLRAQKQYQAFRGQVELKELEAVGADAEELERMQAFFKTLKPGETLNAEQRTLVTQYTTRMKEIHTKIQNSLMRAHKSRWDDAKEDAAAEGKEAAFGDAKDIWDLYVHVYSGVGYLFRWSWESVTEPNTGVKRTVLGIGGFVVTGTMVANAAYGLALIKSGGALNIAKGVGTILVPGITVPFNAYDAYKGFWHSPEAILDAVAKGKMSVPRGKLLCQYSLEHADLLKKGFLGAKWSDRMKAYTQIEKVLESPARVEWFKKLIAGEVTYTPAQESWMDDIAKVLVEGTDDAAVSIEIRLAKALEKIKLEATGEIIMESPSIKSAPRKFLEWAARKAGDVNVPPWAKELFEELVDDGGPGLKAEVGAGLERLKGLKLVQDLVKDGIPVGVAYLGVYMACRDSQKMEDKGQAIARFATGMLIFSLLQKGWELRAIQGALAAGRFSKHPYIIGAVALAAAIGISWVGEEMFTDYAKDGWFWKTFGGTALYTFGAGQASDVVQHYELDFSKWKSGRPLDSIEMHTGGNTERDYFMKEMYLPFMGNYRPAFVDGALGADTEDVKGWVFDDLNPQEAIEVWNYKVGEEIAALRAEEEESKKRKVAGEDVDEVDHGDEIAALELKRIDRHWIQRELAQFEGRKQDIMALGQEIQDDIFKTYDKKITVRERALIESILTTDNPESWMDESFMKIENEERYQIVSKYLEGKDRQHKLETFVQAKRQIQNDGEFYRLLEVDKKIVNATDEDKLLASMGIDKQDAETAQHMWEQLVGDEGEEEGGVEEEPVLQEAA